MADGNTILEGGVLPLVDGLAREQAVAISGDRLGAVGAAADVEGGDPAARVLDFGDRTIVPGFVDTHAHVALTAIGRKTMIDCMVGRCRSIEQIQQRLSDSLHLADETDGWLIARSSLLLDQKLEDKRFPTKEDLDKVSRTVPIALRTSHLTILNSRALEVVDIERFASARHGSLGPVTIERGSDGRPNGIVSNMDSLLPFPEPDAETAKRAIEAGTFEQFTANGVTTICEMSDTREALDAMVELIDEGRLHPRFQVFLLAPGTMTVEEVCDWRAQGVKERPGRFDIHGLKLFADGGYSSRDAATKHPYAPEVALEPGSTGKLTFTDDELEAIFRQAHAAGLQVALHTNGERAQEAVCDLTARLALPDWQPVRLEHAGNFRYDPRTPDAWRRAGAQPMPQPMFIYTMAEYMPIYLGEFGARHGRLPFKSLLADGWDVPSGSDAYWALEEEVTNPLWSMWCCMKRQTFSGEIIDPEEAIDLESALRMHTVNGARALGLGDEIGTLEPGKAADVVVLDRDITDGVGPDEIKDVKVDRVYAAGELVFEREGAAAPLEAVAR
jgi:predicted amidohydrolase YtcJ